MKLRLEQGPTLTDRFGRETTVSIIYVDGLPAAVLHSQDQASRYNDNAIHQEHVIQGLEFKEKTAERWLDESIAHYSCPSRSMMRITVDSAEKLPDVFELVKEDYDENAGFAFLKYGEKGAEIPADASAAFLRGVEQAKQRTHRKTRSGKLLGEPRSW